jgi:hypothetical protein
MSLLQYWRRRRTATSGVDTRPKVYVTKSGNDTTGTGTEAAPWLTIQKAITSTSTAGGVRIMVGPGTYQETDGTYAYWAPTKSFTSKVTIESTTGTATDVVIQGTTDATYEIRSLGAINNWEFKRVSFANRTGVGAFWGVASASAPITNLTFTECQFDLTTACNYVMMVTTFNTFSDVTWDGCIFNLAKDPGNGIYVSMSSASTIARLKVLRCTFNAKGSCISITHATDCEVAYNTFIAGNTTGGAILMRYGTATTTSTIGNNNTFHHNTMDASGAGVLISHGAVFGAGQDNTIAEYNTLIKADLTWKLNTGGICRYNTVSNTVCCIELKGAADAEVYGNSCTANGASSRCLQFVVAEDGGATKTTNAQVSGNSFNASVSGAKCIMMATANTGAGNSNDANHYYTVAGAKVGDVLAAIDLTTLAAVIAAWEGYTPAGNDATSILN